MKFIRSNFDKQTLEALNRKKSKMVTTEARRSNDLEAGQAPVQQPLTLF